MEIFILLVFHSQSQNCLFDMDKFTTGLMVSENGYFIEKWLNKLNKNDNKMIAKIIKLSESENPIHPNNIPTGDVHMGIFYSEPKIGERFNLGALSFKEKRRGFSTSAVQEIIDDSTFKTYNSIYKWELIEDEEELEELKNDK